MEPDPRTVYAERFATRTALAAALAETDRRYSWARAVIALFAIAAWVEGARGGPLWPLGLCALAFVAAVALHSRVVDRRARAERAAAFHERGLARLSGRWPGTGDAGDRFLDEAHPCAADLDLFGRGSLFELISIARTGEGQKTLARWLTGPAPVDEIRARQQAVAELRPRLDLREDLAVLGDDVRKGVDPGSLRAWVVGPPAPLPAWTRGASLVLAASNLGTLFLWLATEGNPAPFVVSVAVSAAFSALVRTSVRRVEAEVERPARGLGVLAGILSRLERERFQSPRLAALGELLAGHGEPPSRAIARLKWWADLLESRRNQLFAPVAFLLLWGPQIAAAVEGWRRRSAGSVLRWLEAVGDLEALSSLAGHAFDHPADVCPEVVAEGPLFEAEGLAHPLLPEDRAVRNDVRLDAQQRLLLVSGSNMSGKSTLLRSVGVAAVLAFAGGTVRARRLRIAPLSVGASIRVHDSLLAGESRFYAEIRRLRQVVDLARQSPPALFLLDEVLHGTNSADRRAGAEAVVRGLLDRGAVGLVTTHDLALAAVVESLAPLARNVHFEDHMEDERMAFDYTLRPGVVERSNALALMRAVGLEV